MRLVSLAILCVGLGVNVSGEVQTQRPPAKPAVAKPAAVPASPADGKVTNADVIDMVGAGLSDQVIIASIRQAPGRNFDLAPSGLVALKKAGVSDALILAMQNAGAPAASSRPDTVSGAGSGAPGAPKVAAAPPEGGAGGVPAAVLVEDGLYYIDGANVRRIEAKTPYQTRTGSTAVSRLTIGIKKAKLNAMLLGLTAESQVSQSPQFYLRLAESESIGEYYLVKFTVNQSQGRRELEVGSKGLGKAQSGFAEKDIFLTDAKRIQKDVYLVTPKTGLSVGEYGLLVIAQTNSSAQTGLTPRKIFDFGVR